MITAGIDAGSRAIKIALFDTDRRQVIACSLADQGVAQDALATALLERTLQEQGLERSAIGRIIATGYGRNAVNLAETTVTEITCHAAGVRFLAPAAMTIVEIGGQDSKLIRLQENGAVRDFAMNDRCAAGTGCFLEIAARRVGARLEEVETLLAQSRHPARISSTCVVFAETEIIGLLAGGEAPADIFAGIEQAIAARVAAMAGGKITPPLYFTGGVALVPGMVEMLGAALGCPVELAPQAQFTGAIGAAVLAAR